MWPSVGDIVPPTRIEPIFLTEYYVPFNRT